MTRDSNVFQLFRRPPAPSQKQAVEANPAATAVDRPAYRQSWLKPMTGAQRSLLANLTSRLGQTFDPRMDKDRALQLIVELRRQLE